MDIDYRRDVRVRRPRPDWKITEDGTIEICYLCDEKIVIPNEINGITVTCLGEEAFTCCDDLKEVTIPSTVTTIYTSTFCRCLNLDTVNYTGTEEEWKAINIIDDALDGGRYDDWYAPTYRGIYDSDNEWENPNYNYNPYDL